MTILSSYKVVETVTINGPRLFNFRSDIFALSFFTGQDQKVEGKWHNKNLKIIGIIIIT